MLGMARGIVPDGFGVTALLGSANTKRTPALLYREIVGVPSTVIANSSHGSATRLEELRK